MKVIQWIASVLFVLLVLLVVWVYVLHARSFNEELQYDEQLQARAPGEVIEAGLGGTHYQVFGAEHEPTIVLVHGFSMPTAVWGQTGPLLAARGFRVVQYDLWGRGFSARPDVPYTGALYEQQLISLLDALSIQEPVAIVGLSMGGAITARTVANHPERFSHVAFIAPLHQPMAPPSIPASLGYYMLSAFYVPALATSISPEKYGAAVAQELSTAYESQREIEGFTRALTSSIYSFTPDNHPAYFQRVGERVMPKLVIWGTADDTVPFSHHTGVLSDLNVTTDALVVFEGAGHLPHLEAPDMFAEAMAKFIVQD
ncbi:MAG: bifunctional 3-oxoadipate enol-lactonase / 4-carboxymuconolactone decarboxylase PcaL [Idiomarinaceae bacterium HL-53]|nr:MAG: bifunctional 3-oxoadipate enol-lactonase / 4-carboxymuconolactone decarboxylase PcaL [Idiomarinaceae bacterium HL-53]CUS48864.1 Pimeloyl-ACP methyl ester carboxylesterase [Idiomarinaceae bacterium HL-53]